MDTEYELGLDVTEKVRKRSSTETAVLSIRLSVAELARLDALARAKGRSISQIVRDAIAGYAGGEDQSYVTISQKEATTTTGNVNYTAKGAEVVNRESNLAVTAA
jgi:predicted transcriptional regulator